jgi:hypothetical protein
MYAPRRPGGSIRLRREHPGHLGERVLPNSVSDLPTWAWWPVRKPIVTESRNRVPVLRRQRHDVSWSAWVLGAVERPMEGVRK